MNAKTSDGTVHAVTTSVLDVDRTLRVACGLKGQQHTKAFGDAVAAQWTNEPVSCLECLAVVDRKQGAFERLTFDDFNKGNKPGDY